MSENEAHLALPWDVLLHIVHLADPPALALLSRISFDLLEATSPLLYHTVKLKSRLQMERFFCQTVKLNSASGPSRIDMYLSFSQIHHLSLDCTFASTPRDANLLFLPSVLMSRLHAPTTRDGIPFHSLDVLLHPSTAEKGHQILQTHLFYQFNPSIYTLTILNPPLPPNIAHSTLWRTMGSHHTSSSLQSWKRLDKLILRGSLPFAVGPFHPPRHELVLDLRSGEYQAGPTPSQRVGSVMVPIGRAEMARRMLKMGWVGREGRLRLLVGTEEERSTLMAEIKLFGEAVREKVDVDALERT